MATTTTHYGFTKPGVNDYVDVAVINANYDNLDNVIYNNLISALDDLAPEYDATATYSVGDYVTYNKTLYRCITAIATAEAFDDTKWTAVKVGGELKSHDARISDLEAGVELEGEATNSFDDGIDSYFKKVVSTIVPVQAGSGTPSPTNMRPITGFTECTVLDISDLTNVNYFMGVLKGTHGFVDLGSLTWNYTSATQQFYVSYNTLTDAPKIPPTDVKANAICSNYEVVARDNATNSTFCIATNGNFVVYDNNYTDATTFKNAMLGVKLIYELETPTTPTITDAQMQTLLAAFGYTGTSATIQFGEAGIVYDARVELISGKLVVNSVMVDLGSLNWVYDTTWGSSADNRNTFRTVPTSPIKNVAGSEVANMIADRYSTTSANNLYQGADFSVAQNASYIRIRNTDYTDAVQFKTAMNGAQLVYELATPQEYQLTPAQLRSLVGANRLTSSTGEVTEVEYIKNQTIAWLLDLIRAS